MPIIVTKEQVDTIMENALRRIEAEAYQHQQPWTIPPEATHQERLLKAIAARDARRRENQT
jgi:hypothetical protein